MNIGISVARIFKDRIFSKCGNFLRVAFSDKYLLYTNVAISISLSGVGDVLEQKYEVYKEEMDEWDPKRTRTMALSGCSVGIVCHYWYRILDRSIPGYTIRTVFKKIVVDQFIGSPIAISTFFMTCGVLEGNTMDEFVEEVKQKAWKLYAAEWMIWPPAQFINFYLLSTKYRVLFDNTVSLGYDVYTSKVKHEDSGEKQKSNPLSVDNCTNSE